MFSFTACHCMSSFTEDGTSEFRVEALPVSKPECLSPMHRAT